MRMCLVITVACVALCATSPRALGGTFEVVACGDAPGGTNNSWAATTNQPAYLAVAVACPPSAEYSGIAVTDSLSAPGNAPTGSTANWQFAAPQGTAITGLRYSRFMGKDGDNDWQVFARTGDGQLLDTCEIPATQIRCSIGQSGYSPGTERVVTGLRADSVRFGVGCTPTSGATTCSVGVQLHRVWATLYSAAVTLEDAVEPLVT